MARSHAEVLVWPGGIEIIADHGGQYVNSNVPVSDENWKGFDSAGHGHFYYNKATPYPTLIWVPQGCTVGHGDDCVAEGHWECKYCHEEVRPGTRIPGRTWIAGPTTYTLKVTLFNPMETRTYIFGQDAFDLVAVRLRSVVLETLSEYLTERNTA